MSKEPIETDLAKQIDKKIETLESKIENLGKALEEKDSTIAALEIKMEEKKSKVEKNGNKITFCY